jgi:hypothetical protein
MTTLFQTVLYRSGNPEPARSSKKQCFNADPDHAGNLIADRDLASSFVIKLEVKKIFLFFNFNLSMRIRNTREDDPIRALLRG